MFAIAFISIPGLLHLLVLSKLLYEMAQSLPHSAVLLWSAIPPPAGIPRSRVLYIAIEATFISLCWGIQSQSKDYGMRSCCLWLRDYFSYGVDCCCCCSCEGRSGGGSAAAGGDGSDTTATASVTRKHPPATTVNQPSIATKKTRILATSAGGGIGVHTSNPLWAMVYPSFMGYVQGSHTSSLKTITQASQ